MKKPRPIPNLDPDVEEEVDKLAEKTGDEILEESTDIQNSIEKHIVDLDTVIKFENKADTKKLEDEENGEKDEGRNIARDRGNGHETALPGKSKRSKLIY